MPRTDWFVEAKDDEAFKAILGKLGAESRSSDLTISTGEVVKTAFSINNKGFYVFREWMRKRHPEAKYRVFREERTGFVREWDLETNWWKEDLPDELRTA